MFWYYVDLGPKNSLAHISLGAPTTSYTLSTVEMMYYPNLWKQLARQRMARTAYSHLVMTAKSTQSAHGLTQLLQIMMRGAPLKLATLVKYWNKEYVDKVAHFIQVGLIKLLNLLCLVTLFIMHI